MASENKPKSSNGSNINKKRKHRFLPQNKPVKKGSYPLHPGVEGFFITCEGGRERQASHEAINVIDSFYEELVHGRASGIKNGQLPDKPSNKKTKFTYSDSSSSDDDDDNNGNNDDGDQKDKEEDKDKPRTHKDGDANHESPIDANSDPHKQEVDKVENKEHAKCHGSQGVEGEEPPAKKQLKTDASKCGNVISNKMEEKSVDKLIEEELAELGDRSKRRFSNLDSGCNGVVFVQMRKRDGDPGTKDIVQHMMTSVASTRKHTSRFMLRVLPVEVTCYASEEEITRAIKPLISQYFPVETQTANKFAVLYEARANTGIDKMKIINAVAKSVPAPHKVDLNNPDKNIVVQIVKTVCLMGVVEKYKELSKYNLRQLTSAKP
ncbi:THUMP domain-containing protein [Actinidia chinensis var. chinensis]|uniref:THUMP domain-containing protein n=1 Tax=Actinidia chinensis var. chinensis TaxID=1590841 RepID=A0A2R6PFJ6_ACTCC|nr:THUMP domain-containing protein [Actinidia chinensis var. chinensis]